MKMIARLLKNPRAAVGAEFALVVPILILFVLGVIDVGRMMWTWNRAEKAAQMGVRYAAVTDMVDSGLASYTFYPAIPRGDPIPQAQFGSATCTSSGCTCTTTPCPDLGTFANTAFTGTVTRMQAIMPEIQPANVTIIYQNSGLGYSGDPYGPDVNPLITVRLGEPTQLTFEPSMGWIFGVSMKLPKFDSTLTMEDGAWAISN
jgi:Flp pilus assembly protein TadG